MYYTTGCLADIRLDGRPLPMENGSENAFVVEARNIITGCPSNNPCEGIHCNHPFECIDLWNLHECRYVFFNECVFNQINSICIIY